jgi:hypothetical protein
MKKLRSTRGAIARIIVILLIAIGVMIVLCAGPAWKAFRYRAEVIGCTQAMKSAGDGLIIEYLGRYDEGSVKQARDTIDQVMPAREENICPAGGTVYLVKDENGIYQPICGLHDSDEKQRTRLNASFAEELLEERLTALKKEAKRESARKKNSKKKSKNTEKEFKAPKTVSVEINGKELECVKVKEHEMIHRGTATTNGYDGVVAFFGIAGEGTFKNQPVEDGEICYFVYADEQYCAIWNADDGWTGDAYQGLS